MTNDISLTLKYLYDAKYFDKWVYLQATCEQQDNLQNYSNCAQTVRSSCRFYLA